MIDIRGKKDLDRVRRHALAAQGLLHTRPFGRGMTGTRTAIRHLGYVQIDSIAVVERAHHHVLHTRVPGFEPAMTNRLLREGSVFEYWAHAAAFLPIEDFRFSLPYKQAIKDGKTHWYRNPDARLMRDILARIRSEGALKSRDLENRKTSGAGWWDWKPAKKAIEQLYMQGDLMISDREGFEKTYDLTERVLPSHVDSTLPAAGEHAAHLLSQQLRSCGFVSLKGITYLRRSPELRAAVTTLVNDQLARGELEQIRLPDGAVYLCQAGTLDHPLPAAKKRLRILSPFDNSVIQRDRLNALFGFDYQLECYLPQGKRRFGYFSLPLLYRDEFVGRMDCKAHRKTSQLEVRNLHFEPHRFDEDELAGALSQALGDFSRFQGCQSVTLAASTSSGTALALRDRLKAE